MTEDERRVWQFAYAAAFVIQPIHVNRVRLAVIDADAAVMQLRQFAAEHSQTPVPVAQP
jgi:hypothetical protein